ncbi:MAG: twin-arginine translocase TatA/TatE family subunit [Chloroflexota bacterium]|nr:MAG: twin-arginine translocase TatA/TatE family subunit [Chloroflexota bacterium]
MPFLNSFGPLELIIILVIALLVIGPGKLPEVGAALGKSIREFRKAATDVKEATSLEPAKGVDAARATVPTEAPRASAVAPAVPAPAPAASPSGDGPAPAVAAEPVGVAPGAPDQDTPAS